MSTPLYTLRQTVGRLLGIGDVAMVTGTPTGGYSTSGFQAAALDQYEDQFFSLWWLRIYSGTHKDITRTVTAFAQTNGAFTFSPVVTGSIDATDLFETHRDFSPEVINSAINQAIARVSQRALTDKVDHSIIVDNLLTDGGMELWSSSSALSNWTTSGTGTLARESTVKRTGLYSAKLTNTVSNAFSIYQSLADFGLYAGKQVSLYARIYTTTASRVRVRLTDGVTTWNSDYHDGTGWKSSSDPWVKIENVTLSTLLTELTASVRIETGSSISAYVDKILLTDGDSIYEYTLPTGFFTIDEVCMEDSTENYFDAGSIIDRRGWSILGTASKKLWLDPAWVSLTSGRMLRLIGQQEAAALTLDADTTDVNAEYIVQAALARLHQSRIGADDAGKAHQAKMAAAQIFADQIMREISVNPRGRRV